MPLRVRSCRYGSVGGCWTYDLRHGVRRCAVSPRDRGDPPELALLAARQTEADIVWTAPKSPDAPARIDDPVLEHARWLLEEWAVRGANSINADLVEETKIAAQLLVRQHG
jgi:hypothetical protein